MHVHTNWMLTMAALALAACGPKPTVKYTLVRGPLTDEQFDSYSLQGSRLIIRQAHDELSTPPKASDFVVKSMPAETETRIALEHAGSWGVSTDVKVSKIENTNLVSEIGVEVTDRRIDAIKAVGGLIASAVVVAGFAVEEGIDVNALPLEINIASELEKSQSNGEVDLRPAAGVLVEVGPVPLDAQDIKGFRFGADSHQFVYAACRTARVSAQLKDTSGHRVTIAADVKVADPRFVQLVGLPLKGSIKAHSECGVSVSSEKSGVSTGAEVAQALVDQAKAIKDAIDAAKKPSK